MTQTLLAKYRKVLEQTFVPIFAKDDYNTEVLLKGCELAGVNVIEYTLRRDDAAQVIPTLKERYPDNVVFVGSTIDDDAIVVQMKEKCPQLMTVDEVAPYVDGFVSMLPYTNETLKKYHDTHILIPAAETSGEAFRQMKNGATFIKTCGPDFSFSKTLHAVPTFNYCPTFITGGVNRERMDEAFEAGNILCAAGLEVVLKGEKPEKLTAERVAELVSLYINTAKEAREKINPQLKDIENMSDEEFLKALPNYCSLK